jgi:hypothetical protein
VQLFGDPVKYRVPMISLMVLIAAAACNEGKVLGHVDRPDLAYTVSEASNQVEFGVEVAPFYEDCKKQEQLWNRFARSGSVVSALGRRRVSSTAQPPFRCTLTTTSGSGNPIMATSTPLRER